MSVRGTPHASTADTWVRVWGQIANAAGNHFVAVAMPRSAPPTLAVAHWAA